MAASRYTFVAAVVGVLALAGCASTATPTSSGLSSVAPAPASASHSSAPAPVVTVTKTVPAPSIGSSTASATGAPAVKGCTTGQVNVLVGVNSGASGNLVQEIDVHNTSNATCTINGHPFISPYGKMKQGSTTVEATLDVAVDSIPATFGQLGAPAKPQTVTHGDYVIFFLKWSQVPVGSKPCVKADGFDFRTPADTTVQHLITFAFDVCGGQMQVSNILPKTDGI